MSHRLLSWLALPLLVSACGGGGGSSNVGAVVAPPPAASGSSCPTGTENISVTKNTLLKTGCVYQNTFSIESSNITFDCNGSAIDGKGLKDVGIKVDSAGQSLKNVTIQNCELTNHVKNGIFVGWDLSDSKKIPSHSRDSLYALTPQYVTIKNTTVYNALRNGIYLGEYVTSATLDNVRILSSGHVGLYMDSATALNTVKNSTFIGNGFAGGREAIAIDASARNTISNNVFQENALAAITLYKNCWEHHSTDPNSFPRWQHSDQNQMLDNQFQGESVGVWIAARQSRDLSGFDCGDPSYYSNVYYLDYAQNNVVQGNVFTGNGIGVLVEDDNNKILNNDFSGMTGVAIEMGAQFRKLYLNRPVVGTVIQGSKGSTGL